MTKICRRRAAGGALLFLAACTTALAPGELRRERVHAPIRSLADRDDFWPVLRVVDALTGTVIRDARLREVPEHQTPFHGTFWSIGTWHADADGIIRVPWTSDRNNWWVIDAPGYGPAAMMSKPPSHAQLIPGVDLPIQVIDQMYHPVPHARVGLCQGCGHTPDLRNATTDSDGRTWLACVDPVQVCENDDIRDLYVDASGHGCVYLTDVRWLAGAPPIVLQTTAVADVHGRFVDSFGKPIAGVAVGGCYHRGPWTKSGEDGRFTLTGRDSQETWMHVRWDARAWRMRPALAGRFLEITLPREALPERPQTRLRVTVRDRGTGAPLPYIQVDADPPGLVHPGDPNGHGETDDEGIAKLEVVATELELRVAEDPPLHFRPELLHVLPAAGADGAIEVAMTRLPVRTVTVDGAFEDIVRVTATNRVSVAWLIRSGAPVPLPPDEPFVLVVENQGRERTFSFTTLPAGAIELRPCSPTRARVRIVDPNGFPLAARAALLSEPGTDGSLDDATGDAIADHAGRVELMTLFTHGAFLEVRADDPRWRPTIIPVTLPAVGDGEVVDLGEVRLAATPQLRLRHRDGAPARGTATILRPGLRWSRELADDGGCDGLTLQAGDRVTVNVEWPDESNPPQALPWTTRLSGDGPWELTIDDAGIEFTFVDQHGLLLRGIAGYLGMFGVASGTERLHLRGLAAGPFELLVNSSETDGARITGWLQPGERRVATIVLHRP